MNRNLLKTNARNDLIQEPVWISTAPRHASNLRPSCHDVSERDQEKFNLTLSHIKTGKPLTSEEFPETVFGASEAEEKDYKLSDLFYAFGFWIISRNAKDVICAANLGQAEVRPVRVLKKDKQTPVGGEWFCISIANRKPALLPMELLRMRQGHVEEGRKGWYPAFAIKDDDVAVSIAALDGADIWLDPDVGDRFFLSDQLVRGLKKAKADRGIFVSRCRTIVNWEIDELRAGTS